MGKHIYFQKEVIDYASLISLLSDYAKPRDKISAMLKSKELIRVKKGLYILGPALRQTTYCKELLANLIYGPSCISLTYALSFYGLIPEKVETLTSITCKRDKMFDTPVGHFSYRYLHPKKYALQINQIEIKPTVFILMATPEKALADTLALNKSLKLHSIEALETYLFDDLRVDDLGLKKMSIKKIEALLACYQHKHLELLLTYLRK